MKGVPAHSHLTFLMVVVALFFTGLFSGPILYLILYRTPAHPWQEIDRCPETPVEIVGYSCFSTLSETIYVRTADEKLYSHQSGDENSGTWERIESVPNRPKCAEFGTCREGERPYRTPSPPGKVLDRLDVVIRGSDSSLQINPSGEIR